MRTPFMYAVGHFALGYLTGKVASKSLGVKINIPLLFFASVLPDVDLLIPGLNHRGPFHSVIFFCFLFLPIFLVYRKAAVPYFVAVIQHIVIGDFLTGGAQLLWPASLDVYGLEFGMDSLNNIVVEWALFLTSITVMFKTRDVLLLVKQNSSNMLLSVPAITVLLSSIMSFPLYVSLVMVIPHIVYLVLFIVPIIVDHKAVLTKN